ncbi:MAG: MipA/OmpV family protein [Hyphomicrobiales bacterium]|nr:MipA/OmpV family protein [Hyphomicrobiales bacterium]
MKNFKLNTIAIFCVSIVMLAGSAGASAQESYKDRHKAYDLDIEIGAAAGFQPAYEGSRSFKATAFPFMSLHFIRLPVFGEFGGGPDRGWSFSPSFRVLSERNQSDDRRLRGLGNIDMAVELGGKVAYRWDSLRLFGEIRRGFGGHHGWTGGIGADVILQPHSLWTVEAGPRLEFADSTYMRRYFGVTPAQSVLSGYRTYRPGGGVKSYGAELKVTRQLTESWSVVGRASFIRLAGDAGKAPLVRAGTENMFSASIGLSYRLRYQYRP